MKVVRARFDTVCAGCSVQIQIGYEIARPETKNAAAGRDVSSRGHLANAEADAGSHDSRRTGKNCLAILPYGESDYVKLTADSKCIGWVSPHHGGGASRWLGARILQSV